LLEPYFEAGNLISRMVNPFLELNAVFLHGLVEEGLLDSGLCSLAETVVEDSDKEASKYYALALLDDDLLDSDQFKSHLLD
ncbi:hypothetical protein H0H93_013142, partial [Arthromyces matolae]